MTKVDPHSDITAQRTNKKLWQGIMFGILSWRGYVLPEGAAAKCIRMYVCVKKGGTNLYIYIYMYSSVCIYTQR